jgi:hypothetical protein
MRRLVPLLALVLVVAGCGVTRTTGSSSKFQGQKADVAKVVDDLANRGRRGDANGICSNVLSTQLVAQLKSAGSDCVTEMKHAISDASDFDLTVNSVTVTGNNATARVKQGGKGGQVATFTFVKEKAGWRASALGNS